MKLEPNNWYWMITPSMLGEWSAAYVNLHGEIVIGPHIVHPERLGEVTFKPMSPPKRDPYKNYKYIALGETK